MILLTITEELVVSEMGLPQVAILRCHTTVWCRGSQLKDLQDMGLILLIILIVLLFGGGGYGYSRYGYGGGIGIGGILLILLIVYVFFGYGRF
jgi:hypothetical protein